MVHRSWAEVSLSKLKENIQSLHQFCKKDIFAVVKADAYGHGAVPVSKYLEQFDEIPYLCVATAEEGQELRQNGISKNILVLGGILKEEISIFNENHLVPVISDFYQLEQILNLKQKTVHLKFDTGMHRLGFYEKDIPQLISFIKKNDIQVEGIMSHFPSADINPELTKRQIKELKHIIDIFEENKIYPTYKHIQNSAGLMYECDYCNAARIGIAIYGEKPVTDFPVDIKPVMSVKSKIISIKEIKKGDTVSYCETFKAKNDMKIATISFGYADGLPRCISNQGKVIIGNNFYNIIGNVTMDMTIIDISNSNNINIGDEVIIVGESENLHIHFSDIAKICKTISYEIMCGISKRVFRKILLEEKDNAVINISGR